MLCCHTTRYRHAPLLQMIRSARYDAAYANDYRLGHKADDHEEQQGPNLSM